MKAAGHNFESARAASAEAEASLQLFRPLHSSCCFPTIENEQLTDDAFVCIALLLAYGLRVDIEREPICTGFLRIALRMDIETLGGDCGELG